MIRFIGIVFVFIFCVVTGLCCADEVRLEYKRVCRMCDVLFQIKSDISFESMTYSAIIEKICNNDSFCDIFTLPDASLGKESFIKALEHSKPFKNEELNERVVNVFSFLGTTDKQTQIELIDAQIVVFKKQADMLRAELPIKQKLYLSLGLAFGAMAAIILL